MKSPIREQIEADAARKQREAEAAPMLAELKGIREALERIASAMEAGTKVEAAKPSATDIKVALQAGVDAAKRKRKP